MTAAAGPLSLSIDACQTLVANVPFFQTWTGTANATDARKHIFNGEVGYPISSVSIAADVLTVSLRDPHVIQVGDTVTIAGASVGDQSDADIDGPHLVTAVSSIGFTAALVAADLASVYPKGAIVMPCTRPIAVICEADAGMNSTNIGTGGPAVYRGILEVLLEADSTIASNPADALTEARNAVGQFIQGLQETSGGLNDFIVINTADLIMGPEFTSRGEQDDNTVRFERWRAVVRIAWGLDG